MSDESRPEPVYLDGYPIVKVERGGAWRDDRWHITVRYRPNRERHTECSGDMTREQAEDHALKVARNLTGHPEDDTDPFVPLMTRGGLS